MKKNILTLAAIALLFAACQNNGSQNNTMTDTTESTIMTTPADEKQVPEVVATYVGTLPAADCGGMATVIHLYADDTYVKQEECASKDFRAKEEGKVTKNENILTLTSESGEKSYFLLKSDSSIILVGEDGKEPEMAAQYTLTKQMQQQ